MSSIPFYTQAAFLEQNAKIPNPSDYPEMVDVILHALDTHEELRRYFFLCGPSPAWARILFERGYLSVAPAPQQVQNGYRLLGWPQQIYLVTVAEQVPDVVCQHLEAVTGHPRYIAVAVEALSKLRAEDIIGVISTLLHHLEKDEVLEYGSRHAEQIIWTLAQREYAEYLFALVEIFIAPTLNTSQSDTIYREVQSRVEVFTTPTLNTSQSDTIYREVQSRVPSYHLNECLRTILECLYKIDTQATISLLQKQLLHALKLERSAAGTEQVQRHSWWRSAIEETDQNDPKDYKDTLLEALRDALDKLVEEDPVVLEEILTAYLFSDYLILRRLGLYLLTRHPNSYVSHVTDMLLHKENLSEVTIHHEIFSLLDAGTPYLSEADYKALVSLIKEGPPEEEVEELVGWKSKQEEVDEDAYRDWYKKIWVRDRLWMIRKVLSGADAELLQLLISETGEPQHPAFPIWSSEAYWVRDVGAVSDDELSEKSPEELIQYLTVWQPPHDQLFGPEQVTYRGMGGQVARLVTDNLLVYSEHLAEIALVHPQYTYAILEHVKPLTSSVLPWNTRLAFFERVLADLDHHSPAFGEISSTEIKRSLIANLEVGLQESETEKAVYIELLPRVRDILIELVEDPDPSPEDDRPAKGWFGHNDPATVALNTVRPSALAALIRCARYRAVEEKDEEAVAPSLPIEPEVKQALERKLVDPSWAVRSVLGRFFPLLYWLDRSWAIDHVNEIFPASNNDEDKWVFVAAWESYVLFNSLYTSLFNELVHKYERAIQLLSEGYKTENHLQPVKHLAMHLLLQFVYERESILTSSVSSVLLRKYFTVSSGEDRSHAAWSAWRYCSDNKFTQERWKSLRGLWEWRTNEAIAAGHTSDFNREINWFVRLVSVTPEDENLLTLWPLLEGAIPHVSSDSLGIGLESLEEFLVKQADTYPLETVQLYRTILERLLSRTEYVYIRNENVRAILEKTALSEKARKETLETIDMCARRGHHQFRDIYERYTR